MKMVYTNESSFLVNNVKNLIETQEIRVFVKNEYAQGALGEISVFDAWAEVWVFNDLDYARAMAIIKSSQRNNTASEWVCKNCSEVNDSSFEICWKCQHES